LYSEAKIAYMEGNTRRAQRRLAALEKVLRGWDGTIWRI
jgi:hypothetical protein